MDPRNQPVALTPIGVVRSALTDRAEAPKQGDEGAPDAWIEVDPGVAPALDGLHPGDVVVVITWLDRADRSTLRVHPRGDQSAPELGVFATRSPDRPNPIGLHECELAAIEAGRVLVRGLEAIDGTPVLDLKPVLGPIAER